MREQLDARGALRGPFIGLWLYTLLLYTRPSDAFPEQLGDVPFVKIVGIATLLSYFAARLVRGERLTIWPFELKMVFLIWVLGVILMPISASPQDSWNILTDSFLKVISTFFLLVNLVDTRQRLRSLLKLAVVCGSVVAVNAVHNFLAGRFTAGDYRIRGLVSGIFSNPNDLAIALALLFPVAVALSLGSRGAARVFYGACAVILGGGVVATFSRGGFLGLMAASIVLLWKLGRANRGPALFWAAMALGAFVLVAPSNYSNRISTILAIEKDTTGSAQERRELLKRAFVVAISNPLIGVGIGNFHIYSMHEKAAHNAYLEVSAELGVVGLLVYLALIFVPLRSIRQMERESLPPPSKMAASARGSTPEVGAEGRENYHFSVALQAAFAAYIVCTFFASVQYVWFLYYIVAYAISLRRIYSAEHSTAIVSELVSEAQTGRQWRQRARPRTRLGLLNQQTNG
jgi:O-antigen ligase